MAFQKKHSEPDVIFKVSEFVPFSDWSMFPENRQLKFIFDVILTWYYCCWEIIIFKIQKYDRIIL